MIFIVKYSRVSHNFKINFRKNEASGEKSTPHKSSENLPVAFGGLLHLGVPYVTVKQASLSNNQPSMLCAAVWSIEAMIDVLIDFLACDQVLLLYYVRIMQ
jgi:hypothetical protein